MTPRVLEVPLIKPLQFIDLKEAKPLPNRPSNPAPLAPAPAPAKALDPDEAIGAAWGIGGIIPGINPRIKKGPLYIFISPLYYNVCKKLGKVKKMC